MFRSGEHAQWEAELVKGAALERIHAMAPAVAAIGRAVRQWCLSMEETGKRLHRAFAPLILELERRQAPGG